MTADDLTFEVLTRHQRLLRDGFPPDLGLRVHRAISWIAGAEGATGRDDPDAAFVCYWIAFNAAYAQREDLHRQFPEVEFRRWYFEAVLAVDGDHAIYDALWHRFAGLVRGFLGNRFVFDPFWRHRHGEPGFDDWAARFERQRNRVHGALGRRDTAVILEVLFQRLYVLRNQLIHGGSTWNGAVNRSQVRDGVELMACLVPRFIALMMAHPNEAWGVPPYPPVE